MTAPRQLDFKTPAQQERALAERRANEEARQRGIPLPFPNPWDSVDATKVPRDATEAQMSTAGQETAPALAEYLELLEALASLGVEAVAPTAATRPES